MILCLYLMTISICVSSNIPGEYVVIPTLIAVAFFWIAEVCYSKTIAELKDEIRELYKKIDNLKE